MHTVTKRIVALTPGKRHYQYVSPLCSDNIDPIRCASLSPDPFAEGSSDTGVISRAPLSGLNITNESPQSPSRGPHPGDETCVDVEIDESGDTTLVQEEESKHKTYEEHRLLQSEPCMTRKRSPSAIRILTAHTHPQNSPSERVIYSWSDTSPDDSRFQYKDSSPYSVKNSTPPTQFQEDSDKENAPGASVRLVAGMGSEICEADSPTQPRNKRRKNEGLKFGDVQVPTEEDTLRVELERVKQNAAFELEEVRQKYTEKISQLETDKQGLYLVIEELRREVERQKEVVKRLRW